jgi:hypothetical protein
LILGSWPSCAIAVERGWDELWEFVWVMGEMLDRGSGSDLCRDVDVALE